MSTNTNNTPWFSSAFSNTPTSEPKRKKSRKTPKNDSIANKSYKDEPNGNQPEVVESLSMDLSNWNWIENFAPITVNDLAVHSKKILEVEHWLKGVLKDRKKTGILLLTGPTGSGKTATIKVLCNELRLHLNEWVTPMDSEVYYESRNITGEGYAAIEKQSDKFIEFLHKASRYNSLFAGDSNGRLILIEDFPNYLIRDPNMIITVLEKYHEWGKSPLVFISTDARGKEIDIARNIFTDSVKEQFKIDHISPTVVQANTLYKNGVSRNQTGSIKGTYAYLLLIGSYLLALRVELQHIESHRQGFNAVSTTGLKSALKRVATLMSGQYGRLYKAQTADTIDSIVTTSIGDIRSALTNLHFASLKDCDSMLTESSNNTGRIKTSSKGKGKRTGGGKFRTMGRDDSLGLLHGVGRVLNPKRQETPYGFTFLHSVDSIVEAFQSLPTTFVRFLHTNYPKHFSNIEGLVEAADCLSRADNLLGEWREKDTSSIYALWLAIGGQMVYNKEPVKQWHPVRGPKWLTINHPTYKELNLDIEHCLHRRDMATDYKTYCHIINSKRVFTKSLEENDIE